MTMVIDRRAAFDYLRCGIRIKITDTTKYSMCWNSQGEMDYLLGTIINVDNIRNDAFTCNYYINLDGWNIFSGMIDLILDGDSNKVLYQCVGDGV